MAIKIIAAVFASAAVIDRLFGNKLGLGECFEKGIKLIGACALAMVGMIVIAPALAEALKPVLAKTRLFDPSVFPALLFANDMGGAALSTELALDPETGLFNALVVSSMMGCTISYTIPVALGITDKRLHRALSLGIMCGVITIPLGCFTGGLVAGLELKALLTDLIPLTILAVFIAFALVRWPRASIKGFNIAGIVINVLISAGLVLGLVEFLTGYKPIKCIGSYSEGFDIVVYACTVISGALPLLSLLSRLLKRPLEKLGQMLGVNAVSALGFVGTLATSMTTLEAMERMDKKGVTLNAAFAVSGGFVLAGHLAFTMAYSPETAPAVVIGKLAAAVSALVLCALMYPRFKKHIGDEIGEN